MNQPQTTLNIEQTLPLLQLNQLAEQESHNKHFYRPATFAREWLARRRSKIHVYPNDWKPLPIAPIPLEEQAEFVRLVDAILAEFEQHGYPLSPEAATRVTELEQEIDERVAALYGV